MTKCIGVIADWRHFLNFCAFYFSSRNFSDNFYIALNNQKLRRVYLMFLKPIFIDNIAQNFDNYHKSFVKVLGTIVIGNIAQKKQKLR
jgi:hypothetical protein